MIENWAMPLEDKSLSREKQIEEIRNSLILFAFNKLKQEGKSRAIENDVNEIKMCLFCESGTSTMTVDRKGNVTLFYEDEIDQSEIYEYL